MFSEVLQCLVILADDEQGLKGSDVGAMVSSAVGFSLYFWGGE